MKTQLNTRVILAFILSGLTIASATAQTVIFDTMAKFTDNIFQTNGTAMTWNAGGYIAAPNSLASALYSVGTPPATAYQNANFYNETISADLSFGSVNSQTFGIYARVDPATNTGILGYVSLTNSTTFQLRLYNSANPTTSGVSSQVGAGVDVTLTGTPIALTDVLTFTMETNPLDANNFTMTLSRGVEVLGTLNRSLTTPVTNSGAVGFRTFGSATIKIYELNIVPEPSVFTLALYGAGVVLVLGVTKRRLASRQQSN
jgi:hypothetical protein